MFHEKGPMCDWFKAVFMISTSCLLNVNNKLVAQNLGLNTVQTEYYTTENKQAFGRLAGGRDQ